MVRTPELGRLAAGITSLVLLVAPLGSWPWLRLHCTVVAFTSPSTASITTSGVSVLCLGSQVPTQTRFKTPVGASAGLILTDSDAVALRLSFVAVTTKVYTLLTFSKLAGNAHRPPDCVPWSAESKQAAG
eukprot:GHUV01042911.1.p2 GENE.GHUV01042911.1~~GHUV01042911.1.p2  ORF type:complete len:130 (-),score=26.94 GHUV01042911.1:1279-1668(-)